MKRLAAALSLALFASGATAAFADGVETWNKKCASCHGKDGKGKTKMGEKLKVSDLTSADVQGKLTDKQITDVVNNGVKDKDTGKDKMPAYKGKLTDAEIAELVKVVRDFKGK